MTVKVLFVCLGNICRSPTAQGVFEQLVSESGLSEQIGVDSAGTSDWHIGKSPDRRATQAAKLRGYDISSLRARQLSQADFEHFDYILAMDQENLANIKELAPASFAGHTGLFLDFSKAFTEDEVPDPYFGGEEGFSIVLDMVEDASRGLMAKIVQQLD